MSKYLHLFSNSGGSQNLKVVFPTWVKDGLSASIPTLHLDSNQQFCMVELKRNGPDTYSYVDAATRWKGFPCPAGQLMLRKIWNQDMSE